MTDLSNCTLISNELASLNSLADMTSLVQPLSMALPQMQTHEARFARQAFDLRAQARWMESMAWEQERVQLLPCAPPRHMPAFRLVLTADAHRVEVLWITEDAAIQVMARTLAQSELKALALDLLLEQLQDCLSATGVGDWHVMSFDELPEQHPLPGDWFKVQAGNVVLARLCVVHVDERLLQRLESMESSAVPHHGLRALLSVRLCVCAAQRVLKVGILRSLQRGDVLLMPGQDTKPDERNVQLRLSMHGDKVLVAQARWVDDTRSLMLESEWTMMTKEHATVGDEEAVAALDDMEITVRLELEGISVPLAQLEAMTPGYVIELGTPVDATRLRMVANGVLIGFAEMVSVGGRMGVRINQLNDANEPELGTDR